jgi:hypothetical protein
MTGLAGMSIPDPPDTASHDRRELISDRWLMGLFVIAVAIFAVSIAAALVLAVPHIHRPSAVLRRAQDVHASRRIEFPPARRARGPYVTITSPSSPTTSA